jgi:Na+-driven multidrug efflux pump
MQGTKNLTSGPIHRQLFNLAVPIMGTSFVQMAYSLTDMAWVGRLGSESVAAIGSVGILTWMTNSISLLNKVGSEVSVGQSIGAQNAPDARSYASHNLTLSLIISICWGLILFVFAEPIMQIYKLEPAITAKAVNYLRIVATAFPFIFLSASFTGIYNASGQSKIPFMISGIGLLLNMILGRKGGTDAGRVCSRAIGASRLARIFRPSAKIAGVNGPATLYKALPSFSVSCPNGKNQKNGVTACLNNPLFSINIQ